MEKNRIIQKTTCRLMALFAIVLSIGSCERDTITYEGEDCIYFDVRRGAEWLTAWAHQFYSTVSFGSTMDNEISLEIPVRISGLPSDHDRVFTIRANADSTTAVAGEDYEALASQYVVKAGETGTTVKVVFHRTPRMEGDTLRLQLRLDDTPGLSKLYTQFDDEVPAAYRDANPLFDYNHDASVHNIFIFDVMTRPEQWSGSDITGTGTFGKFSPTKWKLMMDITGTTIDDYSSATTMPQARMNAIGETMAKYLLEKARMREPVLDDDGTMMYFMAVGTLGGSDAWQPFTRPEDYYK